MSEYSVAEILAPFTFSVYRVTIEALGTLFFHPDKGQTIRGALGYSLRDVICSHEDEKECETCPYYSECLYPYLYGDTFPPGIPETVGEYKIQKTQPYVIRPPLYQRRIYNKGDRFVFDLLLLGMSREYLGYIIMALIQMGANGLGSSSGRFVLKQVDSLGPEDQKKTVYIQGDSSLRDAGLSISIPDLLRKRPAPERCTFRFLTRLRIFKKGKMFKPNFGNLFSTLQRRVISLAHIHCGVDISELLGISSGLTHLAYQVPVDFSNMNREKSKRFSTNQKQFIPTD